MHLEETSASGPGVLPVVAAGSRFGAGAGYRAGAGLPPERAFTLNAVPRRCIIDQRE